MFVETSKTLHIFAISYKTLQSFALPGIAAWRLANDAIDGLLSDSSPKPFDFYALMATQITRCQKPATI
jgi:hypothetical protein